MFEAEDIDDQLEISRDYRIAQAQEEVKVKKLQKKERMIDSYF